MDIDYTIEEKMTYVVSEMKHFVLATELLYASFQIHQFENNIDKHYLFGLLITSWSTHFRCLYDFLYSKSNKPKMDILARNILSNEIFKNYEFKIQDILDEFNSVIVLDPKQEINDECVEQYIHDCIDEVILKKDDSESKSDEFSPILKIDLFREKINKIISHISKERIEIFQKQFAWPIYLYFEFIQEVYNEFIEHLKLELDTYGKEYAYNKFELYYTTDIHEKRDSNLNLNQFNSFLLLCRKKVYDIL